MFILHRIQTQRLYWSISVIAVTMVGMYMSITAQSVRSDSDIKAPVADAYVTSGRPLQSAVGTKYMLVGYDQALTPQLKEMHALLRFQLPPGLKGKVVESAMLSLYLESEFTTPNDVPLVISAQLVTNTWTENDTPVLTWQRRAGFTVLTSPVTTTLVATTPGWYQWNVRDLVLKLIEPGSDETVLGIILISDAKNAERKRSFFSKECPDTDCGAPRATDEKRPKLELIYAAPTPTHTSTPTATPTPMPTATPEPGIARLSLRSDPTGAIAPGEKITYTIHYQAVDYADKAFVLNNVVITNAVPATVELITTSIGSPVEANLSYTYTGIGPGSVIRWQFDDPIPDGDSGSVTYTVQRPLPPSAPANGLHILKQGPTVTRPGLILYRLVTTNETDTVATNLVITDQVPSNAQYVLSSDNGVYENNIVRWQKDSLEAGQRMTVTFVVRASQTIINSAYGVQADEELFATGGVPVVTVVNETGVLPLPDPDIITNAGAWIFWQYTGPNNEVRLGERLSLPTYNPLTQLYLPVIAR